MTAIHPHPLFEGLGYLAGARLYFRARGRERAPRQSADQTAWLFLGCLAGALLGAKLMAWTESASFYARALSHPSILLTGKSIVGGILGGWAGAEVAKACLGNKESVGDAFVPALVAGTAIGRIGCFLTGLSDDTYGIPTRLPWGVDFGDGIRRHPTQVYEIIFVLAAGAALHALRGRLRVKGELFRAYVAAYLAFRFLVEFIKPREIVLAGLSAIQVASAAGAAISLLSWARLHRAAGATPHV
jgi:prolipoprotein diacylglyceryltransferase